MSDKQPNEVLEFLSIWFEEQGLQPKIVQQEGLDILKLVYPLAEDHQVLIEVTTVGYSPQADVAQVYTTIFTHLGPGRPQLKEALNQWNLLSGVGAYGIYEPEGHFYHKHNIVLDLSQSYEQRAENVFLAICVAIDEMARRLVEAFRLSEGQ